MHMFGKKTGDYWDKCGILRHGYKLFAVLLLAFGLAACDDDNTAPEPDPEPTSTFQIHIGEGNIVQADLGAPDNYPPAYMAVLVMEDLPADEKIIYMGSVYSTEDREPDVNDCTYLIDYSDDDLIQGWQWEVEPLYYGCLYLFHPLPGATYYVRGYVKTNKAEYYSNTIEIRSSLTAPVAENPEAYEIPVVFHLFPDAEGNYPVKDWMVREQLDYANHVYSHYFNLPGQTETGVRFVAATTAPDGQPLETPGIVHEKEAVEIDYTNVELDDQYIWDNELALNVWVAPINNVYVDEYSIFAGFSFFPFFDEVDMLPGCDTPYEPGVVTGIFLNTRAMVLANDVMAFAHEAGHFLGLEHVYIEGDDYCDDTPWYDRKAYVETMRGDISFKRTNAATGESFWSDNIMDYEYGFMAGITPDQVKRIQHTLQYAYLIPGEAGKEAPAVRSAGQPRRFGDKPVR